MSVWNWISRDVLLLLHEESLNEHGGASGLREAGLLDSALAKPLNLLACGEPDLADLAAAYGSGLAQNHAFVDGNKRAAFLAVGLFLLVNGHRLKATQVEATLTMLELAAGHLSDADFAQWIRQHIERR